ncbi:MAG: hypothetical protein Q7W56_03115 [Candidatus Latescibacteria bacterium]|nr:hypothetical protein [Candidatus Latescibacterota bacterium]
MKILCSYCSATKREDDGLLPAIERYLSARLRVLWRRGRAQGTPLFILSGEFGLLDAESPIPWYDHLLRPDEAALLAVGVAARLRELGVEAVEYHTASPQEHPDVQPYFGAISAACAAAGASLHITVLPGDPP